MSIQARRISNSSSGQSETDSPISSGAHIRLFMFGFIAVFVTAALLADDGVLVLLLWPIIVFGLIMTHLKRDPIYLRYTEKLVYGFFVLAGMIGIVVLYNEEVARTRWSHYSRGFDWINMGANVCALLAIGIGTLVMFQQLLFKPLLRHSGWIEKNGLFPRLLRDRTSGRAGTRHGKARTAFIQGRLNEHSLADELTKWVRLRDEGIVTEDEFKQARKALLSQIE